MESEWRRNGTGTEEKKSNLLESILGGMEWNWNGNGMELSQQKKSMQNRI